MTTATPTPLPCPFCGATPCIDADLESGCQIECASSECVFRPSYLEEPREDGDTECEDRAITAWNTRPTPPAAPAGEEAERIATSIWDNAKRRDEYPVPSIEFWGKDELRTAVDAALRAREPAEPTPEEIERAVVAMLLAIDCPDPHSRYGITHKDICNMARAAIAALRKGEA